MDVVILSVAVLANILLGFFVLFRNSKSSTNILFFLFNLDVALWSSANYFSVVATSSLAILMWMRLVMFLAVPQAVLFFLLIHTLPNIQITLNRKIYYSLILSSLLAMGVCLSPLLFPTIKVTNGISSPQVGPGMIIFVLVAVGSLIAGVVTLVRKYVKSFGIERSQLRYIMWGVSLMFFFIITLNFLSVLFFNNLSYISLSPLYTFPLSISLAYVIIKHRFLDVRLIVARAVAYILMIIFIGLSYSATLFSIVYYFAADNSRIVNILVSAFIALVFGISFQPLLGFFQKITDKFLYRDKYDENDLLWSLSRVMSSRLHLSELCKDLLTMMISAMRVSHGHIVLTKKNSIIFVGSAGEYARHPFRGQDIYRLIHESFLRRYTKDQIIIYEEIEDNDLKEIMRLHDITAILPLIVRDQLIGGLVLGSKSSGEIYSSADINLLKIVAPEIAIAVRNALSYEEIKHFNITLEEEIERATERLRNANKKLKELDTLKDEFVSIASHELRTPMTAVKSYLWMAINQPGQKIEPTLQKYLDICYASTERLIRLVNDMLTVSRIERNKVELKLAQIDLYDVAEQVYNELKVTADQNHIKFIMSRRDKKPYLVDGDKEKLREVVQNIVGNALKFTPAKGLINVSFERHQHNVNVAISDTGPGIPKESMNLLFKKFSKIDYSYAKHSNQPGTGLGLYISKQIVTLHKGTIEVQSEVGVGTTFTVSLPLAG